MDINKYFILFLIAASVAGCATSVQVSVKHAPEMNLGAVRSVQVEKFSVNGWVNGNVLHGGNSLANSVLNTLVDIAVSPSDSKLEESYQQGLEAAIAQNGYFQIDRSELADAKIYGHAYYKLHDDVMEQASTSSSGQKIKTYLLNRNTVVTVHFYVADKNGRVIGTQSEVTAKSESSWDGVFESDVRMKAQRALDGNVQSALAETYGLVVQKIAPYYAMEERLLKQTQSDQIKKGNKAAKAGNWQEAILMWNSGLVSGKEDDRVAATYNLAVYDEAMDKLDEALRKFEEVYSLTKQSQYTADISRVRMRISEEVRMQKMDNSRKAGLLH